MDPLVLFLDASVEEEDREAAVGTTFASSLLYVVNIEANEEETRIISARAVTPSERRIYEDRA